jgi:hypothetical protein
MEGRFAAHEEHRRKVTFNDGSGATLVDQDLPAMALS